MIAFLVVVSRRSRHPLILHALELVADSPVKVLASCSLLGWLGKQQTCTSGYRNHGCAVAAFRGRQDLFFVFEAKWILYCSFD